MTNQKLNTFFVISLILFSLIPVQAVPPTQYYEIKNCDVELTGAIFVNVNPDSFYASFNDGIIKIDSSIHYTDVQIKFKGIALNNRLRKYNGFNVGYTHIANDGITKNEIKPLVIDYQGFAYLTTDFSTVIINGMTGITTTTLINQTGNISISVPNGTLYDFNITHNQEGVYSINGYDWNYKLPYYQNSSISFNNTQYELNNTNFNINSTVFNHIETDGNGLPIVNFTYSNDTNIPFWVEYWNNVSSFKLYTKTSSGIENKSLFLYYGGNSGLDSSSDGDNTFIQYHGADSNAYLDSLDVTPSNIIYESYAKVTTNNIVFGISNNADQTIDDSAVIFYWDDYTLLYFRTYDEGVSSSVSEIIQSESNKYNKRKIELYNGNVYGYLDDEQISTYVNEIDDNIGLFVRKYPTSVYLQDWAFIRKYIEIEPIYNINIEQTAVGTRNITASITGDNNTQQYNTSQSREFTLTPTGTTNNVIINTTSIDYDITVTTYWTENTTLQTEIAELGYANQYINYTPSYNITSTDLNTTFNFNFSAQDYIGTASSVLNDVSKPTVRNGQDINASVGALIKDVAYWWNVTVLYNNIFNLSNQNDTTAFLGIPKQFTDSIYNDPDDNPIASKFWKFGDSTNSSASNPTHTYTSIGNYSANYTVIEDATTNSQTITKDFNVSVTVQPVQNLVTDELDQTWIQFNWSNYSSADYWNISELEESASKFNGSVILDGLKDSVYDEYAHGFVFDTPNPVHFLDYETILWMRNSTHLIGYADGYDADSQNNDDSFTIGIDGENNNLSNNDRQFILSESGSVIAKRWDNTSSSWLPQATNAEGFVVGAGGGGSITYEMIIPVSEIVGFVDNATVKFFMHRDCSSLNPDVETYYPTNLINDTDATIWDTAILTEGEIYNFIGNTSISEYNSTGLEPYTWYKHRFITINDSEESTPVYSIDITEDVPHYNVSGYILDSFGVGIAGTTVFSRNGVIGEITQADADGYYIGYNFKIGNYSIFGNKSGYVENHIDIYVEQNLTNQNITLQTVNITNYQLWEKLLEIQEENAALQSDIDDLATDTEYLKTIIWVASLLAAVVVISVVRKKIEESR